MYFFLAIWWGYLNIFLYITWINLWQNTPGRRTVTKSRSLSKYRPHSTKEMRTTCCKVFCSLTLYLHCNCRQLLIKISVKGRELNNFNIHFISASWLRSTLFRWLFYDCGTLLPMNNYEQNVLQIPYCVRLLSGHVRRWQTQFSLNCDREVYVWP